MEPTSPAPRRPYQTPRLEDLGSVREATQTVAGGQGSSDGPNYPTETT